VNLDIGRRGMHKLQLNTLLLFPIILLLTSEPLFAQSRIDLLLGGNPNKYKDIIVQEVIGTDTIIIEKYSKRGERIKLIGLKSPEIVMPEEEPERDDFGFRIKKKFDPATPVEERAYAFVSDLLLKKEIRLEFDRERKNDKNQTVAYIFLKEDNTFVNAEILRQGFANLHIRPPNLKYQEELREAYKEARKEKRGLRGQ